MKAATRETFGKTLLELGHAHSDIVVLDADLAKSTKSELFGNTFPDRFFECGIAEGNMIGIAAGLALAGKRPFACSFGCFLIGRFEQIRMSVSYNQAPVVLVGTHAGVTIGEDGHSQMALEDIGLMRNLPDMHVLQPTDAIDTPQIVSYLVEHRVPAYLRLTRQKMAPILPDTYTFSLSEGALLPQTPPPAEAQLLMLVSGGPAEAAMLAAQHLSADASIPTTCAVMNTLWPLPQTWLDSVITSNIQGIITVEDHYTTGGLGSIIAEHTSLPVQKIGIETYGQSGTESELIHHYGLDTQSIIEKSLAFHKGLNLSQL